MKPTKIYFFVGTTAELIKLAPVFRELRRRKRPFKVITSGQNNVNFDELRAFTGNIRAFYSFRLRPIKVRVSPLLGFIIWTVKAFYNYLLFFRHELKGSTKENTYFVVHGDTVSSLLGALIARKFGVTIIHIESGLRSFNFLEPFPEELSRYIVSKLADIHFCPNEWCRKNLAHVKGEKINTGQNTLIESFQFAMGQKSRRAWRRPYCVFVMHRQEHVIFGKKEAGKLLLHTLRNIPKGLRCVFLVHDLSVNFVDSLDREMRKSVTAPITKIRRLPYIDFMQLLAGAEFIVTDGGSNQEETYYMGKPCLLLRNNTERIEGLGENVVLGKSDLSTVSRFLSNYTTYRKPPVNITRRPSAIIADTL